VFEIPEAPLISQTYAVVKTRVIATGVETTLNASQYTITGIGDPSGGTVTYPLSGSPLASTHQIIISRVLPLTQETDLTNQDGFYPEVIEGALDYLTMLVQQVDSGDDATYMEEVAGVWDADGKKISDLAAPVSANDAVRKADLDAAVIANGNVPAPILSEVGYTLQATGVGTFDWQAGAGIADGSVTNAKLADMATSTIKARYGGTGVPLDASLSDVFNNMAGSSKGMIYWCTGAGWQNLTVGTLGQVLTVGASNSLNWETPAATTATPSGAVMAFAMNSPPTGWLKCNGAAVSRATYSALFTAIGTTFGVGDGSTTFNLPDLRGEWVRGWDDGRSVDTGRVFGSAQSEMIGPHNHGATSVSSSSSSTSGTFSGTTSSDGAHTHTVGANNDWSTFAYTSASANGAAVASSVSTSSNGAHTHTVSGAISASTTTSTSTSTTVSNNSGTENRVRNIALLYCIKT
jgi:microcystin-dependent protein